MEGLNNRKEFTQENSPDGGFLQSSEWRKFQESTGKKTFNISSDNFYASIIEHELPIVGKPACIAKRSIAGRYFYIPRGPVIPAKAGIQKNYLDSGSEAGMTSLINLVKENNVGWIRIEPNNSLLLDSIRSHWRVSKAPHNMQPKEILIMDITKPEEKLLAEMKAKTRYNIRLAEKKGVTINVIPAQAVIQKNLLDSGFRQRRTGTAGMTYKYINEFIRLVKITAKRDKITSHPESYYRKMFETIPGDTLKLYVAEYNNKIIAVNIVIFYGNTATYLHGASDYNYRDAMAPYLLQWRAILDAKKNGFTKYDLGGISANYESSTNIRITNNWGGITRFKLGFAPNTKPVQFPGSYDIIINPFKYNLYRILQRVKNIF